MTGPRPRVLFINPPQAVTEQLYSARVARRYSRRAYVLPNTSLAYLAAYLEKNGFEVRILDASALGIGPAAAAAPVREFDPIAICYSLCTQNFLPTLSWIQGLKELVPIPVVVGGVQMGIYPGEVMTHSAIDYGVIGEGWDILGQLVRAIAGNGGVGGIKGVCYREGGEVVFTEPNPEPARSLDEVPFPARHLLPNDSYTTVMTQSWPITVMLSSRGCPYGCTYCDVPRDRYQSRLPEQTVEEMGECAGRYGIKEILFQDETFTLGRDRVMELCDRILARGIKVDWSIRARADLLDREMIGMMKRAGLTKVNLGVESGRQEILERFNRNIPLESIREAVAWTREFNIITLGFFIIGWPGETRADVEATIRFALELECDFIQVNKMMPQPPSRVYQELVKETGKDPWRDYTLGDASGLPGLSGIGSSFSPAELDSIQMEFFRRFYYRPAYIWRRIRGIRSARELVNLAGSALAIR
ncbi:MAG TPA: B12-binding domain-containing radical SAM protein [bacterium]|nr:B12-binding domain-containing radical SAM protein [bacterium]HPQ65180.1 B12-binding domain-containing radical SAM protein [bacterium]